MVSLFPLKPSIYTVDSGDELIEIDGRKVEGMSLTDFRARWFEAPVGTHVWIMLKSVSGLTKPQFVEILQPGKLGSYIYCSSGTDGRQT
jgi:hypothetical protein